MRVLLTEMSNMFRVNSVMIASSYTVEKNVIKEQTILQLGYIRSDTIEADTDCIWAFNQPRL